MVSNMVGKDGSLEWKSQAGFQYADDVCLTASSEEDMNVIMEKIKSKLVCINGEKSWKNIYGIWLLLLFFFYYF